MEIISELDVILKPSKINGIGVFANKNLKKGSRLPWDKKIRKIKLKEARKNKRLLDLCEKYCVETKDYYRCPRDFKQMSVIWFLNHSKKPNLKKIKGFWIVKEKISAGKELTINYEELNEPNSDYLKKYKNGSYKSK